MKMLNNIKAFNKSIIVLSLGLALTACGSDLNEVVPTPEPTPVVNTAPSITSTSVDAATAGTDYSYTLAATDADGDTLTMSATTLPDWLMFDAASGVLSGMPADTDGGDSAIVLVVSDGTDEVTQSFTITVTVPEPVNTAPTITSSANTNGTVDVSYTYTLAATDADGDSLEWSSVILPVWSTFDTSTGVLSGTPDEAGSNSVELMVSDGTDSFSQAFTIVVDEASSQTVELVIFENTAQAEWALWDCCAGSTPSVETDDVDHDQVAEFDVLGSAETVQGFTARDSAGAVGGTVFDASAFAATGTLSFEMKVVTAAPAGSTWILKLESSDAATNTGDYPLSNSNEGQTPATDVWQTYTFDLADLATAGLDLSAIDVVMVFPAWGTGAGAVYRIDNVMINTTGNDSGNTGGGGDPEPGTIGGITDIGDTGYVNNGGFESGDLTGWTTDGSGTISAMQDDLSTWLVKIVAAEAQNPSIVQAKIGEDVITAGQALTVSFDMKGSAGPGGVINALLYSEDPSGVSKTDLLLGGAVPNADWTSYSFDVTAGDLVGFGVSLRLEPVCGAVAGCTATAYFDNVSITAQ